ncbi:MAG: hypothetical protein NTW74_26240, partial [Acidobacteria bacterium]|nr:hypothetical protein [Acidobacteriota bacterium]
AWPEVNPAYLIEDEMEIPVQVNGKLRGKLLIATGSSNAAIEAAALADEKIAAFIAGKEVAKIIVIPAKLVNIVVKG